MEMTVTDDPPWMSVGTYLLFMFLVPYAKTSQERAAAQGASASLPYKAQRFVERVKRTLRGRSEGKKVRRKPGEEGTEQRAEGRG